MIRGVLSGMVVGGVLAVLLASTASLMMPLPAERNRGGVAVGAPVDAPTGARITTPGDGLPAAPAPSVPPATTAPADPPPQAAIAPEPAALPGLASGGAADPVLPAPVPPAPEAAAVVVPPVPLPDPAAVAAASPPVPGDGLAIAAPSPSPVPDADPGLPQAPGPETAAAPAVAPEPPADAPQTDTAAMASPPLPEALPPQAPAPVPDSAAVQPPAEPAPTLPDRPKPGFGSAVDGVRSDRLPRIGAEPAAPPTATDEPVMAGAADGPALQRNARPFANPEGKPPMAVLLRDDPDSGVDLAALAAGSLALTLVIDPTAPDAASRAALWRAAGQEVALLGDALPARGRGTDFEVAMESLVSAFPQALAVVESDAAPLPADRGGVAALVPALAARGFGLVTRDRGLNALDQAARREGLPTAIIYSALDAEDEAVPVIRRYLDRAAFKAQQDGRVVVLGRLRPETVAALQEWGTGNRAATLALAPLSALVQATR